MTITTTVILPVDVLAIRIITLETMHSNLRSVTALQLLKHGPAIRIEGLNSGMREDGVLQYGRRYAHEPSDLAAVFIMASRGDTRVALLLCCKCR